MLNKVKATIEKYGMLYRDDRVIVAVSGGPDSMALLQALSLLSGECGFTMIMAHLNHNIRGEEAIRDERFVQTMSERFHLILECGSSDIHDLKKKWGTSLEDAARRERYRFLRDVALKHEANKIAVGHHRGDQIETVMMNLFRGSGLSGLKGIPPVRDGVIIRPLIDCTREEIMSFLAKKGVPFVQDTSNEDSLHMRNRIRQRIIPQLKESCNPNLEEGIAHTAEILRCEDDYLKSAVDIVMNDWNVRSAKAAGSRVRIVISELLGLHEALQRRVIRTILTMFSPFGKGMGFAHVEAIRHLADCGDSHGSLHLPCRIVVKREYDDLIIHRDQQRDRETSLPHTAKRFCYGAIVPGFVAIPEAGMVIRFSFVPGLPRELGAGDGDRVAYMDFAKVVPPLTIRNVLPGDRIQPLGMAGTKKIKDYFIDRKIPWETRGRTPLLVDSRSVIWIAGMRISEQVKVTETTKTVVRVEII